MAKKKEPLKRSKHLPKLKELHRAWFKDSHPDFPEHCYPVRKFSQKDANKLTAAICAFIEFRGGVANRINNGAVYDRKRKIYRKGGVTPGVPDIDAVFQGKSVKIEVKHGQDRMSEAQLKMKDRMEKAGALYFVARNFDLFYEWFVELFGEVE